MTVFYTADPHWGHRLVAELRGFDDPDEHDTWLADVYIEAFKPGDVVWWLGDLTMRLPVRNAAGVCWATQPDAHHRLIYGNHDAGHPMHREAHRYQGDYTLSGMKLAQPFAKRVLPRIGPAYLSHFPYDGDHTEGDRYAQWRLPDRGVPLIHGHTHSAEKVSRSTAGTLQVHVGIDAWRRPVAEHEIVALIEENQ